MSEFPIYGTRNKSYAKAVHFTDFKPKEYVIVDIRALEDYHTRHLPDACHVHEYDQLIELIKSNAQKKILLQCYSGHTAAELGSQLVADGYDNIYFLDEVLEDYWER